MSYEITVYTTSYKFVLPEIEMEEKMAKYRASYIIKNGLEIPDPNTKNSTLYYPAKSITCVRITKEEKK